MEVRKNKISQIAAKFSEEDLVNAYKDIVAFRDTGVLKTPCALEKCELAIRKEMNWQGEHYQATEQAVLMEIGRRFYGLVEAKNQQYTNLKTGTKVWYVDFETGEIETGKIFIVYFKEGKLDSFFVDFDCGDFDEFMRDAMGECFFLSEEDAQTALRNSN